MLCILFAVVSKVVLYDRFNALAMGGWTRIDKNDSSISQGHTYNV
jgi:hypothetical protein